ISELSAAMNVSMPTANSMVKKLDAQGWLKYEKYKPLTITPKGRKKASLIIRKHRLTEMFLVEKMGFTWENVHEIAEQVEHVQSDAFTQVKPIFSTRNIYVRSEEHTSELQSREKIVCRPLLEK